MLWMKFVIISALRNLCRSPGRTLFSLIAISAAAASLTLSQSFINGVKKTFRRLLITSSYAQYQIVKKGYLENRGDDPFGYLVKDAEHVLQVINDEVDPLVFHSRRQVFHALINFDDRSVSAVGVGIDAYEEEKFMTLNRVVNGIHLGESKQDSIFLAEGLSRQLKLKVGDVVSVIINTANGSLNAVDLEVVGVFRTGAREIDNSLFYIHNDAAMTLLRIDGASQILLGFSNENELIYYSKLKSVIAKHFSDLEVVHWHDLAGDMYDNSIGWLNGMFGVFRIIILVVATLSILTVFMISLLERTSEFGTLRAIGTFRLEVGILILTESLIQSLIGGVLGVAIAVLMILLPLRNGIVMPPPPNMTASFLVPFDIPWHSLMIILSLCVVVAGGAGIYPAVKISRMNIVKAMGRAI